MRCPRPNCGGMVFDRVISGEDGKDIQTVCYKCNRIIEARFISNLPCRYDMGETGDTKFILAARNSEAVNSRRTRA